MSLPADLVAALRDLPDNGGMIEHNPDEGMRMFCCGGDVRQRWRADDTCEHARGCWYVALRDAAQRYAVTPPDPFAGFAFFLAGEIAAERDPRRREALARLAGNVRKLGGIARPE